MSWQCLSEMLLTIVTKNQKINRYKRVLIVLGPNKIHITISRVHILQSSNNTSAVMSSIRALLLLALILFSAPPFLRGTLFFPQIYLSFFFCFPWRYQFLNVFFSFYFMNSPIHQFSIKQCCFYARMLIFNSKLRFYCFLRFRIS